MCRSVDHCQFGGGAIFGHGLLNVNNPLKLYRLCFDVCILNAKSFLFQCSPDHWPSSWMCHSADHCHFCDLLLLSMLQCVQTEEEDKSK